jgi:hypothetical protein
MNLINPSYIFKYEEIRKCANKASPSLIFFMSKFTRFLHEIYLFITLIVSVFYLKFTVELCRNMNYNVVMVILIRVYQLPKKINIVNG